MNQPQKTGTAATIAIIAAIGSLVASFTGHPFIGMLAALLAVPFGIVGAMMASSPRVSGGIMSIFSIFLGVVGVVVALLVMIGVILF